MGNERFSTQPSEFNTVLNILFYLNRSSEGNLITSHPNKGPPTHEDHSIFFSFLPVPYEARVCQPSLLEEVEKRSSKMEADDKTAESATALVMEAGYQGDDKCDYRDSFVQWIVDTTHTFSKPSSVRTTPEL